MSTGHRRRRNRLRLSFRRLRSAVGWNSKQLKIKQTMPWSKMSTRSLRQEVSTTHQPWATPNRLKARPAANAENTCRLGPPLTFWTANGSMHQQGVSLRRTVTGRPSELRRANSLSHIGPLGMRKDVQPVIVTTVLAGRYGAILESFLEQIVGVTAHQRANCMHVTCSDRSIQYGGAK